MASMDNTGSNMNLVKGIDITGVSAVRNRKILTLFGVAVFLLACVGVVWQVTGIASSRGQDAFRWAEMTEIHGALYRYYADHNVYPVGENLSLGEGGSCGGQVCRALTEKGFVSKLGETAYLAPIMDDQISDSAFVYSQKQDGADFSLNFRILSGDKSHPAGLYAVTATGVHYVGK